MFSNLKSKISIYISKIITTENEIFDVANDKICFLIDFLEKL